MSRAVCVCVLSLLAFLALPVGAHAASVNIGGGSITFTAGAGETNTAIIFKQTTTAVATVYFVGDQNPQVNVTASALQGCLPTLPQLGLPAGYLCTVPFTTPITSLVENLGDGNDTGVISAQAGPSGVINGGTGDDTLVSGPQNDTLNGGDGTGDSVAYVGIAAASISRTANVVAALPTGATPSMFNGRAGEDDRIAADVEGLVGGNGDDTLTGNEGPNTIAGSAPPGTPSVDPQPAGTESTDIINGAGGNDTLLSGDSGTTNGGEGTDTVVGGRSFANGTTVDGGNGDDTLVSGLGNDNLIGGAGANTLAYVSVNQGSLSIVNRGTGLGVLARLPEPGTTGTAGGFGTPEADIIHDDLRTLIGTNGDDFLIGSNIADTIVGAAPVGTGSGVVETPAGNDAIFGRNGDDTMVSGDRGAMYGGDGADSLVGGRSTTPGQTTVMHGNTGNDTMVSGLGNDDIFGDEGANTLAYASVQQGAINIVDRGTNGVTARLPEPGQTANGGTTGGAEKDILHSDIGTFVGSNGNDALIGNSLGNLMLGVAPPGTAGVKPGPAGNDTFAGAGGADIMLGAEGNDIEFGGPGNDVLAPAGGNDILIGETGVDSYNGADGNDSFFARDGVAESITCGLGTDNVFSDPIDNEAADCESITAALAKSAALVQSAATAAKAPLPPSLRNVPR